MKRLDIGAVCDIGLRKRTNQDRILALVGENNGEEFGIFAVSDGIGGMDFGELASELTIGAINRWWETRVADIIRQPGYIMEKVDEELERLLSKVNNDIYMRGKTNGFSGGATLSLLFMYEQDFLIKHTGDSRVYMYDRKLQRLTRDQSWIEREVDSGRLTEEEARTHPKRNILMMSLGVFEKAEIQTIRGCIPVKPVFMLCSDGLYGYFQKEELERSLCDLKMDIGSSSQQLANEYLIKVLSKGAHDNISLIIISQRNYNLLDRFRFPFKK